MTGPSHLSELFITRREEANSHVGGLADEVGDLLGELVGAAHHHAVQGGRVLRDVDDDGAHFEDGGVVGLQAALGAVQGLRLGDVALHHRSAKTHTHTKSTTRPERFHFLSGVMPTSGWMWVERLTVEHHADSRLRAQVSAGDGDACCITE